MYEGDQTKSPSSEGDRSSTGHLLSPNEASSIKLWLHLIELLAKDAPWSLQAAQAIFNAVGYSLQN